MAGKFEITQNKAGKYRFRLKAYVSGVCIRPTTGG